FYADSRWLASRDIRRNSVSAYVQANWLRRVAHGLYQRPYISSTDTPQDWRVLVQSMQRIMQLPIHVGGMTALQLQGHRHYLALGGKEPLYLYGAKFPGWLDQSLFDVPLRLRKTSLLGASNAGIEETTPASNGEEWWSWTLRLSSPERAILEVLDELPDDESFHSIDVVFQSLVSLRPRRLTALLSACRSVKVKRLFFVFAERHGHAWFKHLDKDDIDLGSGDRALVKRGRLHPRYRITVPAELLSDVEGATGGR